VSDPRVFPPGLLTMVNPMLVTPSPWLGSEVTSTRKLAVAPEATPPMLEGWATTVKNMNASGVNDTVAGAHP
jgi:hypothetical protein